jgi:hypothetical protein
MMVNGHGSLMLTGLLWTEMDRIDRCDGRWTRSIRILHQPAAGGWMDITVTDDGKAQITNNSVRLSANKPVREG